MKLPVLAIKGSAIEWFEEPDRLRTCTRRALKPGGWFDGDGPRLFDADGVEYRVRSVRGARDTGRKAFPGLFAPRLVEVDLDVEQVGQRSMPEIRDAIVNALRCSPEGWDGAEDGIDKILDQLTEAETIRDLQDVMRRLLSASQGSRRN